MPLKVKALIIENLTQATGRNVTLGNIRLNIFKGIVLEGLVISAEDAKLEPPFLKAKQVSAGWLILPLLKQKQIIIPFINIYSPQISLRRKKDNTLNLPLPKQGYSDKAPKNFPLIIYKVNIRDARINFSDEMVAPGISRRALLDIALSFSLSQKINYFISGNLENLDKSPVRLELKGDFDLQGVGGSAVMKLENLNLESILVYAKGAPITVKKGLIQKLDGNAVFKDGIATISLKADILSLSVAKEAIALLGNAKLDAAGSFNLKTQAFSDYSGSVIVNSLNLSGLPYINKAEDISGKVSFSAQGLEASSLKASALGALFDFNGSLADFKDPRLKFKVAAEKVALEKIEALLAENKIVKLPFEAQGEVKIGLNFDLQVLHPESLRVEGEVRLNDDRVVLSPLKQEISKISGILIFSKDKIETTNLKAAALGGQFKINGNLSDFKAPQLAAEISSDNVPAERLNAFLAQNNLLDLPVSPQGDIGLALRLNTRLFTPENPQIKGEVVFRENKLILNELREEVNAISGKVTFDNDAVEWKGLTGQFKKARYSSSGKIWQFPAPQINFVLSSDELSLNAAGQLKDNLLLIKQLKGKYLNSEFDLNGSAFLKDASPKVNLNAEIKLNLSDLKKLSSDYFPQYSPLVNRIDAKGISNVNLSLSGALNEIRAWDLKANLAVPSLALYPYLPDKPGFKFENLSLHMTEKDMRILGLELAADAYGGKIKLALDADLAQAHPAFNLKLEASGLDLARLKQDTALSDKTLSGLLNATLTLGGRGFDTQSFSGKGFITVKEGNLWEFAPLKKLGQFLFIPSFEKIVFNEAEADVIIADGNIFTDEGIMRSPQVTLYAQGKMDFSGNLDYIIRSEFNPEIARDSSDLMQILSSVIGKVGQFTTLKLTGTIQNPKPTPVILEPLKQLKEIFK